MFTFGTRLTTGTVLYYHFANRPNLAKFYYRQAGVSRSVRFRVNLADGVRRKVVLSFNAIKGSASLVIGRQAPITVKLAVPTVTPQVAVEDCGAASATCVLYVGQRIGSTGGLYRFSGTIYQLAN